MVTETVDLRARRHAATKARILAASWDLAREEGLVGISLRDLAARVDLRQPSLYSYFESKHDLYDAMFAQGCEALLGDFRSRTFSNDPRQAIKEAARAFVELGTADVARAQLLFQNTIPGFTPSSESYALAQQFLDLARTRLESAGITEPRHLDMYTAIIGGLVTQQLANDPGGVRWARLVDETVEMFLDHVLGTTKENR